MPVVPSAQQLGQRVAPGALPNVRFGGQAPASAFAAPPSPDLSGVANTSLQLYREHQRIVEQERAKADQVAVTSAIADHSHRKTQLLYDPKSGALNTSGENAFAMPEPTTKAYQDMTAEVRGTLANDDQRAMYDRYATNDWANTDESIQRHVAKQREVYDVEKTDAALTSTTNEAIASWQNPGHVQELIAVQGALITDQAKRQGRSPEWAKDQVARRASITHRGVISQMFAEGADRTAKLYFDQHEKELVGPDLIAVTDQVDKQTTEGTAMRGSADVWQEYGPQALNEPIKVEDMENELRAKFADDPKILKAAITDLHERIQAREAQQRQVNASNNARVLGAYGQGAPLSRLTRMPEFMALPEDDQTKIRTYVTDRNDALTERAASRADREETRKERQLARDGYAAYWTYTQPQNLAAMSEDQIAALEPVLGRAHVDALLTKKASLQKADDLRAASIDHDLFKEIAAGAGFDPLTKVKEKHTVLGQLQEAVEHEIDSQQHEKHRTLTRDEKSAIMQKIVDDRVMLDISGVVDPEKLSALTTEQDAEKAYVPIDQIRAREKKAMASTPGQKYDFVGEAVKAIRRLGVVGPAASDATIEKQFARRIERAYAARLRPGTTRQQIDAILQERD